MITSKMKKILCVSLSAALVASSFSVGQFSATAKSSAAKASASNAATSKTINWGADLVQGAQKNKIYFGSYQQDANDPEQDTLTEADFQDASGNWNQQPVLWRVLDNIAGTSEGDQGKLLLMSDKALDQKQPLGTGANTNYTVNSDTSYSYYDDENFYNEIFKKVNAEQNLLVPVTIDDSTEDAIPDLLPGDEGYNESYNPNHVTNIGNPDYRRENMTFFRPSIMDVNNTKYGFANTLATRAEDKTKEIVPSNYALWKFDWSKLDRNKAWSYLTRTGSVQDPSLAGVTWDDQVRQTNRAYQIAGNGAIVPLASSAAHSYGMDVLMTNLDKNQILFTSRPNFKPGADAAATGMQETTNYSGANNWKLTISNPKQQAFVVTSISQSAGMPGDTETPITINYDKSTRNQVISAALKAEDGTIVSYGTLGKVGATGKGKVEFTVPENVEEGNYKLLVWSDTLNGEGVTDLASNIVEKDFTVAYPTGDPTLDAMNYTVGSTTETTRLEMTEGTTSYTVAIENGQPNDTVTLDPVKTDPFATVTYSEGSNVVNIVNGTGSKTVTVTGYDGDVVTYTFTFKTTDPQEDATLSALKYSIDGKGDIAVPEFSSSEDTYNVTFAGDNVAPDAALQLNGNTTQTSARITANDSVTLSNNKATATITVTAPNGTTTKTYTVNFTRTPSANVDLRAAAYKLPRTEKWVNFENPMEADPVELEDPHSIRVGDTIELSGLPVSNYAYAEATNAVVDSNKTATGQIEVTAEDGTTQTYFYSFRIAPCKINTLSGIGYRINDGDRVSIYDFAAQIEEYTVNLDAEVSDTDTITLIPDKGDEHQTLTYNETFNLVDGKSDQTITVTPESGSADNKTYTVHFVRSKSQNANLASAAYEITGTGKSIPITLNPTEESVENYKVYLGKDVDPSAEVTVSGVVAHSGATIDDSQATVTLVEGIGTATLVVTAEDGSTTKTYNFNFTNFDPMKDATLKSLTFKVDGGEAQQLSEAFNSEKMTYTQDAFDGDAVAPDASIELVAEATQEGATVSTQAVTIQNDEAQATVLVTSADGEEHNTYTVNFTRKPSEDVSLSSLAYVCKDGSHAVDPTAIPLQIKLDPDQVDLGGTIDINAKAVSKYATVTIENATIDEQSGQGQATVTVVAENGFAQWYTLNFYRISNLAYLDTLTYSLDGGAEVEIPLEEGTVDYEVALPEGTNPTAHIQLDGEENPTSTANFGSVDLVDTAGTAQVVVTAEDQTTTNTYTVTFRPISTSTELAQYGYKVVDQPVGSAVNAPDPEGITWFDVTDPSQIVFDITLDPQVSPLAAIQLYGRASDKHNPEPIGELISLNAGTGRGVITVTAESGATAEFTVNLERTPFSIATLSYVEYTVDGGAAVAVPNFDPNQSEFNVELPYGTNPNAVIALSATTDTRAEIEANEGVTLSDGKGIARIELLAEDGVTKNHYTFNFTTASAPEPTPEPTPSEGESTFTPADADTTNSTPVTGDAAGLGLAALAMAGAAAILLKKKRK